MNRTLGLLALIPLLFFVCVFLAVGAMVVGSSVHEIFETRQWMRTSAPASATIEERHETGSDGRYEATVLFNVTGGAEVSAKVAGKDLGKPGSRVDIRYDPDEPTSARLSPAKPYWLDPLLGVLVVGVVFFWIPLRFLVTALVSVFWELGRRLPRWPEIGEP